MRRSAILVVDDFAPWRHFVCLTLQSCPEWEVVGEATDGLGAVEQAEKLQPDLILLDIGLPVLGGIAAAQRIRELSPKSRILFLSANHSWDIAEEALLTGASGYVVKSDATTELLPAIESVLHGKRFLSTRLDGYDLSASSDDQGRHHEAGFYVNDRAFLDDVALFIGAALNIGNSAIVVAIKTHRADLLLALRGYGLDMNGVVAEGRYIALDAVDARSEFMRDGMPDPFLFIKGFGDLIMKARKAAQVKNARVVIFGEGAHLLWAEGNTEAAIQTEKLCNQLTERYDVDILCSYFVGHVPGGMDHNIYQRICAEHSAVYSR